MERIQIRITLNGEQKVVDSGSKLGAVLAQFGVSSLMGLACERNGVILVSAMAAECVLEDGDDILLVRMVGGG